VFATWRRTKNDKLSAFLLQAEAIEKAFPGVHALDEVTFDLKEGEVHVLLGQNDAGKSTLMKAFRGPEPRVEESAA
jgi:ABC-type sugar transport system ATPase subunit